MIKLYESSTVGFYIIVDLAGERIWNHCYTSFMDCEPGSLGLCLLDIAPVGRKILPEIDNQLRDNYTKELF